MQIAWQYLTWSVMRTNEPEELHNLRPGLKLRHGERKKLIQETSRQREWVSMEKR